MSSTQFPRIPRGEYIREYIRVANAVIHPPLFHVARTGSSAPMKSGSRNRETLRRSPRERSASLRRYLFLYYAQVSSFQPLIAGATRSVATEARSEEARDFAIFGFLPP